jgi:hypothetical protein
MAKAKACMASSSHSFHDKKNHAFIYTHIKNAQDVHLDACNDCHVLPMRHDAAFTPLTMISSSSGSYSHSTNRPRHHAYHVVSHGPSMLYRTFDASYVLYCKNDRIVASNVGPECKKGKTCIWVTKPYVTNLTGRNTSWGPIGDLFSNAMS